MWRPIWSGGWPRACPLPCALWMVACGPEKGDADTAATDACEWIDLQAGSAWIVDLHADGDPVALRTDGFLRWEDGAWRAAPGPEGESGLSAMDGPSDHFWAWSRDHAYEYNCGWTDRSLDWIETNLEGVVVRADGRVVAWGSSDAADAEGWGYAVSTWDGDAWTTTAGPVPEGPLRDAVEVDGTLVFVGDSGVYAEEGDGWTTLDGQGGTWLAATAWEDELIAVGFGGQVLRGPLDALELLETDLDQRLTAVDVEPGGVIWALNYSWSTDIPSVAIRVEGDDWTSVETGTSTLRLLAVAGEDDVLLGGNADGTLLMRGGAGGFEEEGLL